MIQFKLFGSVVEWLDRRAYHAYDQPNGSKPTCAIL